MIGRDDHHLVVSWIRGQGRKLERLSRPKTQFDTLSPRGPCSPSLLSAQPLVPVVVRSLLPVAVATSKLGGGQQKSGT